MDFLILLALLTYVWISGWAITTIGRIEKYRIAVSYAFGMGWFAVCLLLAGLLLWDWRFLSQFYLASSLFLIVIGLFLSLMQSQQRQKHIPVPLHAFVAFVGVMLGYISYYLIIGPYDLVPADTLRHLERIQFTYRHLTLNNAPVASYIDGLNAYYIYYLYALLWHFMQTDIYTFLHHISLVTALIFLASFFWFVYHASQPHIRYVVSLSVLSTLFFVLHQGYAGFPYLKYYALSATLWCMPLFFLSVLLLRDFFQYPKTLKNLFIVAILIAICGLYHLQESLFIVVMAIALWVYYLIVSIIDNRIYKKCMARFLRLELLFYVFLAVIAYFLIDHYWLSGLAANPIDHFKLIDLANFIGFGQDLFVLNPFLQFNQVATHFGMVVLLLAMLSIKKQMQIPILMAGLFVPLLTVFNPIFIDVFLHFRDVHVVYRFVYIVPFAISAAYFVIITWTAFDKQKYTLASARLIGCFVLIASLFPLAHIADEFRYSRLPALGGVAENQSLRHWKDVSEFVNQTNQSRWVVTDALTGYILTATTRSISPRYKFIPNENAIVARTEFNLDIFRPYDNALLVVNLRDGGESKSGVLSTHWPNEVLKTSNRYSDKFLDYVKQNPENFIKLWQQQDVSIYRINVNLPSI